MTNVLANAAREYMVTIGSNPIFAPKLFYGQRACGKVESNDSAFEKFSAKLVARFHLTLNIYH